MTKLERFQCAFDYLKSKGYFHTKADCAQKLGRTRTNVSAAYNGREPFFNDKFILSFCRAYPEINYEWVIEGEGNMLQEPEEPKKETPADYSVLELYAQLIRRVDDLRVQLETELRAVREERAELRQLIGHIKASVRTNPYADGTSPILTAAEAESNEPNTNS